MQTRNGRGASTTRAKHPASVVRTIRKRRRRRSLVVTSAGQWIARPTFLSGAASVIDPFGLIESCDRIDPTVRCHFVTEDHLRVAICWLGGAIDYEADVTAGGRLIRRSPTDSVAVRGS